MTERTEYAVLRFVDKNGYCHMINDYVQGSSLAQYVKKHPQTDKEIFWDWLEKISALAVQYYKWSDAQCYGYFNPFAVILTDEGGIAFLDTKDEENEELVGCMQRKSVRALFMKPERVLSLKITFDDDMYSLGKTIQFLAAKCRIVPGLTRREEKTLKRIIAQCMDKREKGLKELKEIHRELKSLQETGEKRPDKKRTMKMVLGTAAVLTAIAAIIAVGLRGGNQAGTARAESRENETQVAEDSAKTASGGQTIQEKATVQEMDKQTQTQLEMGLLYLTELEDEERSRACLEEISEESSLAEIYLKIIHFLAREKSGTYVGRELEQILKAGAEALEQIKEEAWWGQKQELYQMPFLHAYGLLNTESAAESTIEICAELLENDVWKEREQGRKRELEVRTYLAAAFETADEKERAIEEYETVKELEEETSALEQIYMKLEGLYVKTEQKEKMWEVLKEGTEKIPGSEQIWIRYLKHCCGDSSIEREACAEYVKNALTASPNISENEEFIKLQKEYEITVEGDSICVGK